jgi:hypothetical protein
MTRKIIVVVLSLAAWALWMNVPGRVYYSMHFEQLPLAIQQQTSPSHQVFILGIIAVTGAVWAWVWVWFVELVVRTVALGGGIVNLVPVCIHKGLSRSRLPVPRDDPAACRLEGFPHG